MSYSLLKSGSDIRGVASDIFEKVINLTDEAVYDISAAFVCYLADSLSISADEMKISVGHDSRISADRICKTVIKALVDAGVNVVDCGLSSTPAMFMTTVMLDCIAAIQITASHHPADRNGIKFFLRSGGLNGTQIGEILDLAENKTSYISDNVGNCSKYDFMSDYAAMLRKKICDAVGKTEEEQPLKNYHIIVDAGNGAGGFYAYDVLAKLGADISGSQYLEPDGMFPNHIPNPENEKAMESICNAVVKNNADLGIIFDTDVDRAGCVDRFGEEINRNRLIALASAIVSKENPGATIVTDSVTSDGLKAFIEDVLGCKHYRYKRGYRNVIDKSIQLCDEGINSPLAIETSGHAALRENYFLDDGAYLITRIVIEVAKGTDIDELLKPLKCPAISQEFRFDIIDDNFKEYGNYVLKELEKFAAGQKDWRIADDNREGIRVCVPEGWFLLRLSVHDPVMPINLESNVIDGNEEIIAVLRAFLSRFEKLKLNNF
ncbi:MAG: phosphomannomutase/phosphoglucomutase [Acutalibacteraceae bacterium]|nr:phosphomannomutase/phosphoglucomutase [Acutalibacteraceae bacterium]